MATSARDVIMVFRAQNYLSGAIRRVGRDVGSLSRGQQLANQRAMLQLRAQQLRQTQRLAEDERASIMTGSRRLAQAKAYDNLGRARLTNANNLRTVEAQIAENITRQANAATVASSLQRRVDFQRPLRGYNMQETTVRAVAARRALEDLQERQQILNQRMAIAQDRVTALAIDEQRLAAVDAELAEREAFLTQRINNTTEALELNSAAQRQNALAARMLPLQQWRDYARNIEHAGRVLQMVGLISTAVVATAAHAAANLSTQSTLAATQARPPGAPVARTAAIAGQVQNQVISLMREFPASAQEMNDAFYQIFSGTNIQNVEKASADLRVFNQMAVAGGASLDTMTQAGISLMNIFGVGNGPTDEFKNMTQAANTFFAVVRYGRLNADQLAQALGYIAPIAKDVGLSFKNTGGDIAFFTRQTGGRMTRQDAQGIARLYQLLAREDVTKGLAQRGIEVWDKVTGRMRPVVKILDDIRTRLHLTHQQTINFFKNMSALGSGNAGTQGTIQALRIFSLGVHSGNAYRDVVKKVGQDQNEMVRSFEAMSRTPGVRWGMFINQVKALVYVIGTQAIPVFIKLSQPIQRVTRWFMNLNPHTQRTIALFLTIGSVATLLLGTVLAVAGGIASLALSFALIVRGRGGIGELISGAKGAAGALEGVSAEAGFISMKLALGLGIPALLILMIKFHSQVNSVVHALGGWGVVITTLTVAMAAFSLARTITAMTTLTTQAAITATAVSRVRLALLAINGFVAVATLIYVIKKRHGGISDPLGLPDDFKDRVDADLNKAQNFVTKYSGAHAVGRLLHFPGGFGHYAETKTPAEQQAEASSNAIKQAVADSPRYQHAVLANQRVVVQEYLALARRNAELRRRHALDRTAGITPGATQARSVQQWIGYIERLRRAQLGSPNDLTKATAYEKAMDQLNARFKNQPALLAAINDVLGAYSSDTKKAANDTQALGITFDDVMSKVQSMYDEIQSRNQSQFGTLFSGPFVNSPRVQNRLQWGGQLSGRDLIKDLRSQITQFRTFHGALDNLARKGAPTELLKQLQDLGPEALKQIQALNQLNPQQLRGYFKLFSDSQQIIQRQTLKELNSQLHQYDRYGKNIALHIIAGLRSEQPGITKALTQMIHGMFPGLPRGTVGAGGRPTHTPPPKPPVATTTKEIHHHHHDKTEINVTAPKKDTASIRAQIRHAELARRHRYTGRGGPTK